MADVTPKIQFNCRNRFVLDGLTFDYEGKEYMNLKYVVKKINKELKEGGIE